MNDSLQLRIRGVFRRHVERDNGLIVGPERLLAYVLIAVADWLEVEENVYRDAAGQLNLSDEAEALRDLRMNLIWSREGTDETTTSP